MDPARLTSLTGHVVRSDYKQPDEPDVLPPPDALVVAPATFNTMNKWAYGSSDTLALGLLNEAIGLGLPVVAVPTPSTALAKHPAFVESIARLRSWGVTVLFDPEVYPLPTPNMGPGAAELFPWAALTEEARSIRGKSRIVR
jgi:phosphopantothenoylcysteine synthetase/decarboxylase